MGVASSINLRKNNPIENHSIEDWLSYDDFARDETTKFPRDSNFEISDLSATKKGDKLNYVNSSFDDLSRSVKEYFTFVNKLVKEAFLQSGTTNQSTYEKKTFALKQVLNFPAITTVFRDKEITTGSSSKKAIYLPVYILFDGEILELFAAFKSEVNSEVFTPKSVEEVDKLFRGEYDSYINKFKSSNTTPSDASLMKMRDAILASKSVEAWDVLQRAKSAGENATSGPTLRRLFEACKALKLVNAWDYSSFTKPTLVGLLEKYFEATPLLNGATKLSEEAMNKLERNLLKEQGAYMSKVNAFEEKNTVKLFDKSLYDTIIPYILDECKSGNIVNALSIVKKEKHHISHIFACIFWQEGDTLCCGVYDPMYFVRKTDGRETNYIFGVVASYITLKFLSMEYGFKIKIQNLSNYCVDKGKGFACVQYHINAEYCPIYSLYFLLMFAKNKYKCDDQSLKKTILDTYIAENPGNISRGNNRNTTIFKFVSYSFILTLLTFISKDAFILTTIYDKQRLIKEELKDKYRLVIDILEPSVRRLLFKKIKPFIGDEFKRRSKALTDEESIILDRIKATTSEKYLQDDKKELLQIEKRIQELTLEQAEYEAEFAAGEAQERMIKSKENNQKGGRLLSSFNKQKAGSRMQTITKKNRMRKKKTFKRKF